MKIDAVMNLYGLDSELHENGDFFIVENGKKRIPSDKESREIDSEVRRLRQEIANTEYARLRKTEYDQLNQFELMYNDKINGTNTWGEAIQAIKDKYPKPEEEQNG